MLENPLKLIVALVILWGSAPAGAQTISLHFRGMRNLDSSAVDQHGKEAAIAGLSGITWRGGDEFLAVQDNSNRIVRLAITFHNDGAIDSIKCLGAIALADVRDFEGIAMVPGNHDHVLLAEEQTPAVHEYDLTTGRLVRSLQTPPAFAARNSRPNFGFESLAASDQTIWTANEEALKGDGGISDEKSGCAIRLLRFGIDGTRISAGPQFVYLTDPIHDKPTAKGRALSRSGVSDLMILPGGRLLVLERSFVARDLPLPDFRSAIYEVGFTGATDVSGSPFNRGLIGQRFNPVTKKLVWSYRGAEIGNLEGIALGPKLGSGRWAGVGVIDNNGIRLLTNRAAAFEIRIEAEK